MMQRLIFPLAWGVILLLTLLLGRAAVLSPPIGLLFTLLILACGLWWLFILSHDGLGFLGTPLDSGLVLLTAALLITSHYSIDPVRSYRLAWAWLAALWSFYFFLTFFRWGGRRDQFLTVLSIVLFLFVIFGYLDLVPQLTSGGFNPRAVRRLLGLTGSANILAMFVVFGGLIQIERLLQRHPGWPAALGWLILAVPIFYFSRSRSAILALAAGVFLLVILRRLQPGEARFSVRQLAFGGLTALILFGGAVGVIFLVRPDGFLGETGGVRLVIWRSIYEHWQSRPLLGFGLDTEGTANLLRNRPVFSPLFLRAAHSLWFTLLNGTGLVGLAAAAATIYLGAQTAWRQRTNLKAQALPAAALAALLIHATLDTPEPWMLFLGGCFLALYPWPRPDVGRPWRYFPLQLWVLLVISGLGAFSASRHYQDGLALAEEERWGEAAAAFDRAVTVGPYRDSAALLAAGLAHSQIGNDGAAIERFEQLLEQEPGWPGNYVNLAVLYDRQGDPSRARAALQTASGLAPDNEVIGINLALAQGKAPENPPVPDPHPFWAAAARRDWATARSVRDTLPQRHPLADGVLALGSGDSAAAKFFFDDAVSFNQSLEADLWQLWLGHIDSPAALQAETTALLGHRTLIGISPSLAAVYPQTIFSRRGLPIDLVPGVWCRVSHPTIDLHLAILSGWLSQNGRAADAQWISDWQAGTHPTYGGLVMCGGGER